MPTRAQGGCPVPLPTSDRLGVHRLFARLDVEGTASVRLCERLGMRREAHLVENDLDPERGWGSEYVYAALAHDLKRWEAYAKVCLKKYRPMAARKDDRKLVDGVR